MKAHITSDKPTSYVAEKPSAYRHLMIHLADLLNIRLLSIADYLQERSIG